MADVVRIDGRDFAVGDCVLVEPAGRILGRRWFAGTIREINLRWAGYCIAVIIVDDPDPGEPAWWFASTEVHSIRENFA